MFFFSLCLNVFSVVSFFIYFLAIFLPYLHTLCFSCLSPTDLLSNFCSYICFCSVYSASILLLSLYHLPSFFAPLIWPSSYHLFFQVFFLPRTFLLSFGCRLHFDLLHSCFSHLLLPSFVLSHSMLLLFSLSHYVLFWFHVLIFCIFLHYLSFQIHFIVVVYRIIVCFILSPFSSPRFFPLILWSSHSIFSELFFFPYVCYLWFLIRMLFFSHPLLNLFSHSVLPHFSPLISSSDILFWPFLVSCSFLIVFLQLFSFSHVVFSVCLFFCDLQFCSSKLVLSCIYLLRSSSLCLLFYHYLLLIHVFFHFLPFSSSLTLCFSLSLFSQIGFVYHYFLPFSSSHLSSFSVFALFFFLFHFHFSHRLLLCFSSSAI